MTSSRYGTRKTKQQPPKICRSKIRDFPRPPFPLIACSVPSKINGVLTLPASSQANSQPWSTPIILETGSPFANWLWQTIKPDGQRVQVELHCTGFPGLPWNCACQINLGPTGGHAWERDFEDQTGKVALEIVGDLPHQTGQPGTLEPAHITLYA